MRYESNRLLRTPPCDTSIWSPVSAVADDSCTASARAGGTCTGSLAVGREGSCARCASRVVRMGNGLVKPADDLTTSRLREVRLAPSGPERRRSRAHRTNAAAP
jgi:hypothetical protein